MKVPTVWIRNKKTGKKLKVNVEVWASDLGSSAKGADWELVRGEMDDVGGLKPENPPKKTTHVVKEPPPPPEEEPLPESLGASASPEPEAPPPAPRATRRRARS